MHPWVLATTKTLKPLTNSDNAVHMKSYMRNQFEFYGIQSGPRRAAMRPMFARNQLPSIEELPVVIAELWSLPEREYQMVAGDLLKKLQTRLPLSYASHIEQCITTKSWWDTVDLLATNVTGAMNLNYPEEFQEYLTRWSQSENIWLRRTTILYQLKYKDKTNFEYLSELIKLNQDDKEFFIQKAIGWALREYSKTEPTLVTKFVEEQELQGLARREALKWLHRK